ncbi:MAG: hypothetical protein V1853_00405 [bacterium]
MKCPKCSQEMVIKSEQLFTDHNKKLEYARTLVDEGKGKEFLDRNAYAGIMPKSAESLLIS